ncbi:MAG: uracil-DNA glycosylase [Elusimicrobia bacterium RIFCSPLOWO2_01_FULL_64_13]|nr:MAG: uracil-DNA glycosylase [Elusimicrobia bacterium RIFCSPLOWO2_01_FULL_64_13]
MPGALRNLEREITACRACPRLVRYLSGIREKFPSYWCKPVPGFGDPKARLVLLGLAPGRYGSNRTGRMFTGDASGRFLYPALYKAGLANQPNGEDARDGLKLKGAFITAIVRCAPPQNKPKPDELRRCAPYFARELALLKNVRVILALGKIAHDACLKHYGARLSAHPFKHGAVHLFPGRPALVDIYHPSRQNTQTGLLTMGMFLEVLRKAQRLCGE